MSFIPSKTPWKTQLKEDLMISSRLNKNNPLIYQVVLTVIYLVGMIGFSNPEWKEELQPTSGVILYISTFIMALASKNKLKFMVFMSIAFIIGFGTEAIGVNTGFLFGDYQYGSNLGPKVLNVSVVIGLLWGVLALSAASIVDRIVLFNKAKVFFSALLMLFVDVIMEPVAIANEFWTWSGTEVPTYNYICWFLIALVLQMILSKFRLNEKNKVYDTLLVLMVVFFSFLNLY